MSKKMIFYVPYVPGFSLNSVNSGSSVRPHEMLAAFQGLGYEVDVINGPQDQRKKLILQTLSKIQKGSTYDFLYMETSTLPLHLTEPRLKLLLKHPFMDADLLLKCKKAGMPIGVFYRDIHWKFQEYKKLTWSLQRWFRKIFYMIELKLFGKIATKLFVPHLKMAKYIPLKFSDVESLPPGTKRKGSVLSPDSSKFSERKNKLNILYVGGLGQLYDFKEFMQAVVKFPEICFTICCREKDLRKNSSLFKHIDSEKIKIIHKSGEELESVYQDADLVSVYVKPTSYWEFAMPVKLFEYIGYQKPILAAANSAAGDFVLKHQIGWALPYESEAMRPFLKDLIDKRESMLGEISFSTKFLSENTWEARAQQVASSLSQ